MSVEIAWKQNILVTDFHLLKSLLVVFGFGSQAFVCGFSRQNINSVINKQAKKLQQAKRPRLTIVQKNMWTLPTNLNSVFNFYSYWTHILQAFSIDF